MAISYKDAGVDLDSYAEAMSLIPGFLKKTHTPGVLPLMGGFAGLFQLQGERSYTDPVLVSGTDGVGTKIKVAILAGKFDTVGIDLVAMCVNDCLCLGARPLFFLDYIALWKDDPALTAALVSGVTEGCLQAGAALLGGETAIMPDLYATGDFDMAGFCVGVVEKSEIIDGKQIQADDVLIGVESSGIHSNGFSLVRKAVFDVGQLQIEDHVPELDATVGEVLLTPTRIYASMLSNVLDQPGVRPHVTGIAHITGGGLEENVGRIIPSGLRVEIDMHSWQVPGVFHWIQKLGDIATDEMFRVFNMGIGMVLIVRPEIAAAVQQQIIDAGLPSYRIGHVVPAEAEPTA